MSERPSNDEMHAALCRRDASYDGLFFAGARTTVPPGSARHGCCIASAMLSTPLGPLVAAATGEGVALLEFADRPALQTQARTLRRWFDLPIVPGTNEHLETLERELCEYFAGARKRFEVPLAIAGTPFQRAVWERLLAIPFGETRSYEQVAVELGRSGAQRAVGRANGDNRLAILIPCHRVVQKDGSLRGYGGGLWRKRFLLDLERGQRDFSPSCAVISRHDSRIAVHLTGSQPAGASSA